MRCGGRGGRSFANRNSTTDVSHRSVRLIPTLLLVPSETASLSILALVIIPPKFRCDRSARRPTFFRTLGTSHLVKVGRDIFCIVIDVLAAQGPRKRVTRMHLARFAGMDYSVMITPMNRPTIDRPICYRLIRYAEPRLVWASRDAGRRRTGFGPKRNNSTHGTKLTPGANAQNSMF
jgi:hypothetical protein